MLWAHTELQAHGISARKSLEKGSHLGFPAAESESRSCVQGGGFGGDPRQQLQESAKDASLVVLCYTEPEYLILKPSGKVTVLSGQG